MKKYAVILAAVILAGTSGCGEKASLPEAYTELPDTIKTDDVAIEPNEPAYKCTVSCYKNNILDSEKVYYYDSHDNKVIYAETYGDYEYRYKYDTDGNILEQAEYNYKGGLEKTTRNTYNADGLLIKSVMYKVKNKEPDVLEKHWYSESKYDDMGSLIRQIIVTSEGTVLTDNYKYEYDVDGNAVKKTYDAGTADYIYEYTYDSSGNMLTSSENHKFLFKTEQCDSTVYEYDSCGNLIKEKSSFSDGSADIVITYEYDTQNRQIRKVVGSSETVYEYEDVE